jgi:hypothetical protein
MDITKDQAWAVYLSLSETLRNAEIRLHEYQTAGGMKCPKERTETETRMKNRINELRTLANYFQDRSWKAGLSFCGFRIG